MLNDFNTIFQFSISAGDVIKNLFVALVCGVMVAFFYRKTYNGPGYLKSFVNSLLILSMITAIVIMVIGNNLARAFGLVGAMSIIRFRTAVKETQDIIFIFFSLAVGMAAGVGLHSVAIISTLVIGLIYLLISRSNFINDSKKEYLLQFNTSSEEDNPAYLEILKKYCKKYNLINAKGNGENFLELSYYVTIKDKETGTALLRELKKLKDLNQVNLFFDEEYF